MVLRSGLCVGMAGLFVLGCGGGPDHAQPLGCTAEEDLDGDHRCGDDDCDETNPNIFLGSNADETCMDANCDGIGGPDTDADGHDAEGCAGGDDCDDGRAGTYPGALDMVGVGGDEDCDGLDGVDADHDLHASEASGGDDCNDADASIYPGATDDIDPSGIDENCSGADGVDRDGDGHPDAEQGGDDCDDRDALTFPGAPDEYGDQGQVDTNCDGVDGVDADLDGFASDEFGGSDCDDANANIHPFSQGDWTWEILSESMRGDPPSAALASDESARVAFIQENDIGSREVVVASNDTGAWASESVAAADDCVALALDVDDAAHLVYRNVDGSPQYARRVGDNWVPEPIAGSRSVGTCTVGVDPVSGTPATAFTTDAFALTFASRAGGAWAYETIGDQVIETTDVSLAIDDDGGAHVAFSDAAGVHYAARSSGWELADVGDGTAPWLALLGLEPRIAYRGDDLVRYAYPDVDAWADHPLGQLGASPQLVLDGGDVHIILGDEDPNDPTISDVLWEKSVTGGLNWSPTPVPPVDGTERWGRMLVTSDSVPLFFVVRDPPDAGDPQTLYFVKQAPRNNVDDDCDGRVW